MWPPARSSAMFCIAARAANWAGWLTAHGGVLRRSSWENVPWSAEVGASNAGKRKGLGNRSVDQHASGRGGFRRG